MSPNVDPMDIRFIAEPWDAAGAYQLGRSFPAKACFQWNGRFRDDGRRFVRGDPGLVPTLMQPSTVAMTSFQTTASMRSILTRASTTLRRTMALLCTTWFPTTTNITSPTATITRTDQTRTSAGTAAGKATREFR